MIDKSKLKELALAATPGQEYAKFSLAANPAAILELLAELESARNAALEVAAQLIDSYDGVGGLRAAAIRALATTTSTEPTDQAHVMPPFAAPAGQQSASGSALAGIVAEIHRLANEGAAYHPITVTITHGQYLALCREEAKQQSAPAFPQAMPEAVRLNGEPEESFYRRVVHNNGWNACRDFVLAAAPAVPVPVEQDQVRDAARYRWLREQKAPASFWPIPSLETQDWRPTPQELDKAIDGAMAAPSLQQESK